MPNTVRKGKIGQGKDPREERVSGDEEKKAGEAGTRTFRRNIRKNEGKTPRIEREYDQ